MYEIVVFNEIFRKSKILLNKMRPKKFNKLRSMFTSLCSKFEEKISFSENEKHTIFVHNIPQLLTKVYSMNSLYLTKPNQKKLPYILGCKAQHNTGINLRTNETGPFLRSKVKRIYLISDKYPLPEFISTIKWTLHYCINTVNRISVLTASFFESGANPIPTKSIKTTILGEGAGSDPIVTH